MSSHGLLSYVEYRSIKRVPHALLLASNVTRASKIKSNFNNSDQKWSLTDQPKDVSNGYGGRLQEINAHNLQKLLKDERVEVGHLPKALTKIESSSTRVRTYIKMFASCVRAICARFRQKNEIVCQNLLHAQRT